jgi:alpha-L-fucosidase
MEKKWPKGDTSWFVKDRFGMFIHWGIYAVSGRHEWIRHYEEISNEDYQKYFDYFDPDLFEPKAWAKAAVNAGMKYFVITTKHHDGFCLWDSAYTEYKSTNTACGKDLLREIVDAFRAEGLKVGLYYSLLDWYHPDFTIDNRHPERNRDPERKLNANRDMSKYAEYMRNQVRELLTQYGKIDILFFDFTYPEADGKNSDDWEAGKMIKLVRELQPDIIMNERLGLSGSGDLVTPEQHLVTEPPKDENGNPVAWEACQTFSGNWGYSRDETTWKSIPMLVRMLVEHVALNGNLLLNVGPTGRGTFDYRALKALDGMGEWMKYHSRAIYNCQAAPEELVAPLDCRYTWNPETNRLYLHLFAWPFKAVHLPGLAGKVKYAQLLNDGSELKMRDSAQQGEHSCLDVESPEGALTIDLPIIQPDVVVPVIELFMK